MRLVKFLHEITFNPSLISEIANSYKPIDDRSSSKSFKARFTFNEEYYAVHVDEMFDQTWYIVFGDSDENGKIISAESKQHKRKTQDIKPSGNLGLGVWVGVIICLKEFLRVHLSAIILSFIGGDLELAKFYKSSVVKNEVQRKLGFYCADEKGRIYIKNGIKLDDKDTV